LTIRYALFILWKKIVSLLKKLISEVSKYNTVGVTILGGLWALEWAWQYY